MLTYTKPYSKLITSYKCLASTNPTILSNLSKNNGEICITAYPIPSLKIKICILRCTEMEIEIRTMNYARNGQWTIDGIQFFGFLSSGPS